MRDVPGEIGGNNPNNVSKPSCLEIVNGGGGGTDGNCEGEGGAEKKGQQGMDQQQKQIISSSLDSEDDGIGTGSEIQGLSPEGRQRHCKIVNAFTQAFAKQNVHFERAIISLDSLNDQLIAFIFSPQAEALHLQPDLKNGEAKHQDAVKVALALMRSLLLDAQGKFRKLVEENKSLGGKIDVDLQSAYTQMALLRAELTDTNKRLSQLSSPPGTPGHETCHKGTIASNGLDDKITQGQLNGVQSSYCPSPNDDSEDLSLSVDLDSLSPMEMRRVCERMLESNRVLQRELKEMRTSNAKDVANDPGAVKTQDLQTELQHAKAALSALKTDRKRLKAEKFELLNQMKQLYVTLEDKEKELRDFIRSYEQRMSETEGAMHRLATERDEAEREHWNILRHARDEAERRLAVATQLNLREAQVHQIQEELIQAKRQLSQYGLYAEPERSNSTNVTSHYSLVSSSRTATPATTTGDRGSSADSGVRLSSGRDSGGGLPHVVNLSDSAIEAISLDLCGDGSGDGDSMSVISTATLPQLFATPRDSPGPLSFSSLTKSMDTSALSRSSEQLLAVEAMEAARRKSGRRSGAELGGRTSTGAKGAWGSISRVFARNKNRRALDPSLYEGLSAGQRSSWSPQSSVPPSPLTQQETFSDKLRALEEAATLPMELWRAGMVQAWIEVSLGMPQYGSRCGDNIKSGKVLLELSNADLETELGVSHPLHRKKLRLAVEEHRNPALVRFPCIVELSHVWVSSEWLPDIGLPQYADNFASGLVDARLLDHLSKKDLEKYLGVTRKFHLAAIAHGVHLLRMVAYDRQALAERRRQCENDPLVWTNQHFVQWARSIDLNEYAENLKGSGVHGAFAVLEPSFNGDTLASSMGIPTSKQIIRRHLNAELDALLCPARATITQQYRVTKCRVPTLDKHRSDSLGRNSAAALNEEVFRRSTAEDSRRGTGLRGSLSRALGLKLKQDLVREKERKYGEVSYAHPGLSPPPLPPNQPGKFLRGSATHSLDDVDFSPQHYPNQTLTTVTSSEILSEEPSSETNDENGEGGDKAGEIEIPVVTKPSHSKHRRGMSLGHIDADHLPVQTPV